MVTDALRGRPLTRYAVEAAIAAVHAEAPSRAQTNWAEIVGLYDVLLELWPSPVVELNRAVAVGMREGPQAGLDALAPPLAEPALVHVRRPQRSPGRLPPPVATVDGRGAGYEEALTVTDNDVERRFLAERLTEVQAAE